MHIFNFVSVAIRKKGKVFLVDQSKSMWVAWAHLLHNKLNLNFPFFTVRLSNRIVLMNDVKISNAQIRNCNFENEKMLNDRVCVSLPMKKSKANNFFFNFPDQTVNEFIIFMIKSRVTLQSIFTGRQNCFSKWF